MRESISKPFISSPYPSLLVPNIHFARWLSIEQKTQKHSSSSVSLFARHFSSSFISLQQKYSLKTPFLAEAVQFSYIIINIIINPAVVFTLSVHLCTVLPIRNRRNRQHRACEVNAENKHCTVSILSVLKSYQRYLTFRVEQPTRKACRVSSYITESEDLHSKHSINSHHPSHSNPKVA